MNIEEAIYSYLTIHPTVSELAGPANAGGGSVRGYPMTIPQTAQMPCYAYQVISQTEIMDHDGLSKLFTTRVQFTCQAGSYGESKELARAIGSVLRGRKGLMGDLWVESGEVLNEFDGYGAVGGVYTTRVDVGLMYRKYGNVAGAAVADVVYDWYVDSVYGSDSYEGTSAARPFATIAKLLTQTIGSGQSIGLARGSTWREQLSIPANSVTAVAYGIGDDPRLDCRDVAANASFTKTGGQTNVYQITVSPDLAVSGTWNSVWEDGARLVRATSIANCDATPGSYYPSSDTVAPITMYVHASDSSSLITNGKVYLYSQRRYSVESYAYTGVGINGIVGIGNLGESGSFRIGKSSILYGCQALEGNKHNVYVRTGCWIENMTASLSYYGTETMGLFAYNEDTPNSEGITYINCIADMGGTLNLLQTGYMGHNNIGGVFGSITYTGCSAADCLAAFGGQHATFTLTNCTVSNCVSGLAAQSNTTISGGTWTTISATGRLVSCLATGLTIAATGLTGTHQEHGFFNSGATCTFVLTNCTLTCTGNGANVWMQGATSNTLTSNGNHFTHGGGGYTPYWFNNANYTFTGDNNNYKAAGTMYANGFLTFAQWQAAVTPQDANSTVG